jgi:predicted secreted protein
VPIAASTTLPGVKRIAFLIEKNLPTTLAGVFEFSDAVETSVSTRVTMARTSNVLAVAITGGPTRQGSFERAPVVAVRLPSGAGDTTG